MKKGSFISINPNGRVPAIEDPNTWITLCESDAIVVYLVETYNKGWKISFQPGSPEYFHAKQWLHFQMSGQGPYFGQWAWLKYVHPEKFQSAQDPYMDETKRVSGVLDKFLEGREYLVGGSTAIAIARSFPGTETCRIYRRRSEFEKEFPRLDAWFKRQYTRPVVAKILKDQKETAATQPTEK